MEFIKNSFKSATASSSSSSSSPSSSSTSSTSSSEEWEKVSKEKNYGICPITQTAIVNPVQDKEGNIYEKEAILTWLRNNNESPLTRSPLKIEDLVELRESVQLNVVSLDNENHLIQILPPQVQTRAPVHICCVVDTSGSMQSEATAKNSSGAVERSGLSILDVVKHSVRTILELLSDNDEISIVQFNNAATVQSSPMRCTSSNKSKVLNALEKLTPTGCTNLWDGLKVGLDVVKENSKPGQLDSIFLLTDGCPNVEPPRGHIPTLQNYLDKMESVCTINTFGFGYSLDTQLLNQIASIGQGSYAFIPDAGLVGTVFIHSITNALCSHGQNTTLMIELSDGAKLASDSLLTKVYPSKATSWGYSIDLGPLSVGFQRTIPLELDLSQVNPEPKTPEDLNKLFDSSLKFNTLIGPRKARQQRFDGSSNDLTLKDQFMAAKARMILCNELSAIDRKVSFGEASGIQKRLQSQVEAVVKEMHKPQETNVPQLLQDVSGQVQEACSRQDYLTKWGYHYIPSLAFAHRLEMCNNFKDPGVQHYASAQIFEKIRDQGEELFGKLPPPKPSRAVPVGTAPLKSMRSLYLSRSNPCFGGNCLVTMKDGKTQKRVADLVKGDQVFSPTDSRIATVQCVVKTLIKSHTELVKFEETGLVITPYHPIRINGEWAFPCQVGSVTVDAIDAVYSFVLDQGHVMIINSTECVSLGHDFVGDSVVSHPYFGSQAVVEDLQKMVGWSDGLVKLTENCGVRDPKTKLIVKLEQELDALADVSSIVHACVNAPVQSAL